MESGFGLSLKQACLACSIEEEWVLSMCRWVHSPPTPFSLSVYRLHFSFSLMLSFLAMKCPETTDLKLIEGWDVDQ